MMNTWDESLASCAAPQVHTTQHPTRKCGVRSFEEFLDYRCLRHAELYAELPAFCCVISQELLDHSNDPRVNTPTVFEDEPIARSKKMGRR